MAKKPTPEQPAAPKFVRFFRSVEGRLVSRWGTPRSFIGARRTPKQGGGFELTWDTEAVTGFTQDFCDRYVKELDRSVANGDLEECKAADHAKWCELRDKREAERDAELKKAAEAKAKTTTTENPE